MTLQQVPAAGALRLCASAEAEARRLQHRVDAVQQVLEKEGGQSDRAAANVPQRWGCVIGGAGPQKRIA